MQLSQAELFRLVTPDIYMATGTIARVGCGQLSTPFLHALKKARLRYRLKFSIFIVYFDWKIDFVIQTPSSRQ